MNRAIMHALRGYDCTCGRRVAPPAADLYAIAQEAATAERARLRAVLAAWGQDTDEERWTVYETDRGHQVIGLADVERLLEEPEPPPADAPRCICGSDANLGMRYDIVCPKHDADLIRQARRP